MFFSSTTLSSLFVATLLTISPLVNALQDSDIPSACQSKCDSSVALLNGCGLNTDGSNANADNMNCFCPNIDHSGYDSCTSCIQNHQNDDDNNDNGNDKYDQRKRSLLLMRRDLLGNLLNIGGTLCTVNGVVSDATSIVGAVTSSAISLVTDVLDNGSTSTRTYSPTSYYGTTDYEGTTTVYASATVTAKSSAEKHANPGAGVILLVFGFAAAALLMFK